MATVIRSASQRPPSPTFTTISGISNYRSDSYRAPRSTGQSAQEIKAIAQVHHTELTDFLATHVAKELPGARANAREKLTRLTRQQFMELSTDVYDELVRRNTNPSNEVPYLPQREDFHPKRNQARQKLASLPKSRFKDLASDVYFELGRRNPEFKENNLPPPDTPGSQYGSEPSPGFNVPPVPKNPYAQNGANSPVPNDPYRRPSADDYRRPSMDDYRRPSMDDIRDEPMRKGSGDDTVSLGGVSLYGRRPSNASPENSFSRRPSEREANANTATTAIVIPAKSTIETEEIQTPFAGDRTSTASSTRQQMNDSDDGGRSDDDAYADDAAGFESLAAGLARGGDGSGGAYYDNSTYAGSNSSPGVSRSNTVASTRAGEEAERIRRDYEFKLATMKTRLSALEGEVADALRQRDESEDMVRKLNEELDDLRVSGGGGSGGGSDPAVVNKLRDDMGNLFEELKELSIRNDALMEEKEQDAATIRDLDAQMKDYKRKYEQAKTELRSVKATSQLYLQAQSFTEDQLPLAQDGVLLDVHVSAFQSAMDALLAAGRTSTPARVLQPMKSVVDAVSALLDDVSRAPVQTDAVQALQDRTRATLSNLLTAARTHATSYGMAPVSLLDAAASHVALCITELGKSLRIRRATRAENDAWARTQASGGSAGESPVSATANGTSGLNGHTAMNGRIGLPSPASAGGGGESWDAVRPRVEAQADIVLKGVQTLLATVRGAQMTGALGDALSEVITLSGSVAAQCAQAPPRAASLVRDISEHAERLSAAQDALPPIGAELGKDARQAIAKASFGIANAVKELLKV